MNNGIGLPGKLIPAAVFEKRSLFPKALRIIFPG